MKTQDYEGIARKLLAIDVEILERQDSPALSWCIYLSATLAIGACLCLILLAGCVIGDLTALQGLGNLAAWVIVLASTALCGFIAASRLINYAASDDGRQEIIREIEGENGFLWQLHFLLREVVALNSEALRCDLYSDAIIDSASKKDINPDLYLEVIRAARSRLAFCSVTRDLCLSLAAQGKDNDF